jgi:benzylsuccinate CoA-transferase BbsE subunit
VLEGVRVLDLSEEPGYLAGKILGELGADVVKCEPPGGDLRGRRGPYLPDSARGDTQDPERSLPWLALNTSKRGITLDLENERGCALFADLAMRFDVVLETFTPGTLDERGIGYAAIAQRHPRAIWCALTPFGQSGPRARHRAHDLVSVALGGNPRLTGDPDRPPVRCTLPTAYLHAGPEAATGIAMALYAREDTGRGRFVDVSMHEVQLSTLMTGPGQHSRSPMVRERTGPRLGRTREIWKARDGDVSFGLRSGQARIPNLQATVAYMDESGMAPAWLRDYEWSSYNHNTASDEELARLEECFGAFFATKTRRELYDQALERRIMLAPCNDAEEIVGQPQLRSRDLFTTIEYPELGAALTHPEFFARSKRCRIGIRARAPRIGEHNAEIYAELGLGAGDLESLARQGVI